MMAAVPAHSVEVVCSSSWDSVVATVNLAGLQSALAAPELWRELALLEKVAYKSANQHATARHFHRLLEVRRLLRLLRELQLAAGMRALEDTLAAARRSGRSVAGGGLLPLGSSVRRLPSQQAALLLLHRLRGGALLVEALLPALLRASSQLLAQLAHSFFMPLCLSCLALLARVRLLASQLLLDAVRAYNAAAELAPILPAADLAAGASGLDCGDLPQALRVDWAGGIPRLEGIPFGGGASLRQLSEAAAAVHGFARPAAAAVPVQQLQGAVEWRREGGRRPSRPPPASMLAVVEDRGMPISREELEAGAAAEAAAAAAPVAAAATSPQPAAAPSLPAAQRDGLLPPALPDAAASAAEGAAPVAVARETSGAQAQVPVAQSAADGVLAPDAAVAAAAAKQRPAGTAAPGPASFFWEAPAAGPAAAHPTVAEHTPAPSSTAVGAAAAAAQAGQPAEQVPLYRRATHGLGSLGRNLNWRELDPVAAASPRAAAAASAAATQSAAGAGQPQAAVAPTAATIAAKAEAPAPPAADVAAAVVVRPAFVRIGAAPTHVMQPQPAPVLATAALPAAAAAPRPAVVAVPSSAAAAPPAAATAAAPAFVAALAAAAAAPRPVCMAVPDAGPQHPACTLGPAAAAPPSVLAGAAAAGTAAPLPVAQGAPQPAAEQVPPPVVAAAAGQTPPSSQPAPQLALELRRKRRRANSSTPLEAEPAAPAKSWEDWLTLGGGSSVAPGGSQQQQQPPQPQHRRQSRQ